MSKSQNVKKLKCQNVKMSKCQNVTLFLKINIFFLFFDNLKWKKYYRALGGPEKRFPLSGKNPAVEGLKSIRPAFTPQRRLLPIF